jgi:biliverdin reductase
MEKILRVGLVGTGYTAQRRAETFQQDERTQLVTVAGNTLENIQAFCQTYSISSSTSWQELVNRSDIDLVVICTINRDHGAIAYAALEANKHVLIEYPLALKPQEAEVLIELSQARRKTLHVEHIELLGGLHQAIRKYLPEIGEVYYARYHTINPQRPAPRRWTYHHQMFGFPFCAALSRIHRFTDLFGSVFSVSCQSRFWDIPDSDYYTACLCNAQLRFNNGLIAEIVYGKGDVFWQGSQTFELYGDNGALIFDREKGNLVRGEEKIPIEVISPQGLFAKDTSMFLDYLLLNKPLYVKPTASLYALKVADAAYRSTQSGTVVL